MRILFVAVLSLLLFPSVALAQEVNVPTPKSFKEAYAGYNKYIDAADDKAAKLRTIYAQKAYELGLKRFGPESINTANLAVNWVYAYNAHKSGKTPIEAFLAIEPKYVKANKDNLETLIDVYVNFASLSNFQKFGRNSKQIIEYFDKAISLTEDKFGNKSYQYGKIHLTIGTNLLMYYSPKKSETYLNTSLQYFKKNSNKHAIDFAITNYRLAESYLARKKFKQATEKMELALKVLDAKDPDHQFTLVGHATMVDILENQGKSKEATKHLIAIGKADQEKSYKRHNPVYIKRVKLPRNQNIRQDKSFVDFKFDVDKNGYVRKLKVMNHKGSNQYLKLATRALKQYRYAPNFENGKPIPIKNMTYTFTLTNISR